MFKTNVELLKCKDVIQIDITQWTLPQSLKQILLFKKHIHSWKFMFTIISIFLNLKYITYKILYLVHVQERIKFS